MIDFSIIIPTFNSSSFIHNCIKNLLEQKSDKYNFEIIFIDDYSSDNTVEIIENEAKEENIDIQILRLKTNYGPGIARNLGIEKSHGKWILFLDSDDILNIDMLKKLVEFINKLPNDCEVIGFNWKYKEDNIILKLPESGGRYDVESLNKSKNDLIYDYLSLWMDNSVIYSIFKKDFIIRNHIRFRTGIHEDVDFMFKAYYYCKKVYFIDEILYIKNNREDSIINNISENHINGFFDAYDDIYRTIKIDDSFSEYYLKAFYNGIVAVLYTLLVRIIEKDNTQNYKEMLFALLFDRWNMTQKYFLTFNKEDFKTKYMLIAEHFTNLMNSNGKGVVREIQDYLSDIRKKSWSCYDLHNSLFLAPDEVRVCCKRFFVDNKMKGDVSLLKLNDSEVDIDIILQKKHKLYYEINKGISSECGGCPFLEFKEWPAMHILNIEYLSFEYHSKCNMKCIYCSEKYYGGKSASYDVLQFSNKLIKNGALENCKYIIWGGGEPLLDKSFNQIVKLINKSIPHLRQKVITNATVYSQLLYELINQDKAYIVTSIDAGNSVNFNKIRRNSKLKIVMNNLVKYSQIKPENIIIKYILLDGNSSYEELSSFVEMIKLHNLQKCNMQISFDFKQKKVDDNTIKSALFLYELLYAIRMRYIYFDDLFYQRLESDIRKNYDFLKDEVPIFTSIANSEDFTKIIIWGAGDKTKKMLEESRFFTEVEIAYIVDDSEAKIGTEFCGYKVYSPDSITKFNYPVFISSYIYGMDIMKRYLSLGFKEENLIKKLII